MTANVKFITTFSNNGYKVYGKSWIESFLNFTQGYDHISAKIYVDHMNVSELDYGPKIDIVDFDSVIPLHKPWTETFLTNSVHDNWNRDLAVKFSFKSFVMINELKHNSDDVVIWLDADCVFTSDSFSEFPFNVLDGKFVAVQKESGSEHCESGIVIFNSAHPDKEKFVNWFENQYLDPDQFNSYGQFFDGFVLHRTITNTGIDHVDLNDGHGINGIQSDPNCTFLNPTIADRFKHNIGLTGKRNYQDWKDYYKIDPFFQLIPDVNTITPQEALQQIIEDNIARANERIAEIVNRRHR